MKKPFLFALALLTSIFLAACGRDVDPAFILGCPYTGASLAETTVESTGETSFWELVGQRVQVPAGATILAAAIRAGVYVNGVCGGDDNCPRTANPDHR